MANSRVALGLVTLTTFAVVANAAAGPPPANSSAPAPAKPALTPAPAKPAPAPATPAPTPPAASAAKPAPPPPPASAAKPAPAKPTPVSSGAPTATPAPGSESTRTEDRSALATRVAVLERAGKPLGLGVVLNGDGRIAAALSSLAGSQRIDAHYADGKVVPVRVGHADRARDLALLVPLNAEHQLGLKAARESTAALHAPLGSFVAAGTKAAPGPLLTPTGPVAFTSSDGKPYPEALGFSAAVSAASLGSPLVDSNGEVIAIVTRACQKKVGAACTPVLVGTPVGVVREFLRAAPKTAALPAASLGIQVSAEDTGSARGVRITNLRGPALGLGLRAGADARFADVIVALDGVPVTTAEAFDRQVEEHATGDVVDLLVLGSGHYRHVTAVVAAAPR